jgi:hypothetical protein
MVLPGQEKYAAPGPGFAPAAFIGLQGQKLVERCLGILFARFELGAGEVGMIWRVRIVLRLKCECAPMFVGRPVNPF